VITIQHTQECLSRAYVQALAAKAGVNLTVQRLLDYGIDGSFHAVKIKDNTRIESGCSLRFQLKASVNWFYDATGQHVVYDLEAKTYNHLCSQEPEEEECILILLCLHSDADSWLQVTEQSLVLRHCCYWHRISGASTTNKNTKRIEIPRANLLTADAVGQLLADERQRRLGLMK
jgi:hypothetical protein